MDKLIFERGNGNSDGLFDVTEPTKITFDIPSGVSVQDFKIICKRLASAIGYQQESIEDAFGDETTDKEMAIQAHIHEMLNRESIEKFFDMPVTGSN